MQEQLIALLGNPVTHSRSPQMHNTAFQALKLPYRYMAFQVEVGQLNSAIMGLKAIGFRGANVTIPHKISIIPYLDDITPLAKEIGAVNTIYVENGRLLGDNTDGKGYLASLFEEFPTLQLQKLKVAIIGAGGAARAVAITLAQHGINKLWISNRTKDKTVDLVSQLSSWTDVEGIDLTQLHTIMPNVDLLIQTTSVGMHPSIEDSLVPRNYLLPTMIISDLVYNPIETKLLRESELVGAKVHSGVGMLLHQGALAFEGWTGKKAPLDLMKKTLLSSLQRV